jgi:hypothetical protein
MAGKGRCARARKVVNVSSISAIFGEATQFSRIDDCLHDTLPNLVLLSVYRAGRRL